MNANHLAAQGKPIYESYMIHTDTLSGLPKTQFTLTVTFKVPYTVSGTKVLLPCLSIGSLVILKQKWDGSHVGMITNVTDNAMSLSCVIDFWELREKAPAKLINIATPTLPVGIVRQPMSYSFSAETDNAKFSGTLMSVNSANAAHLRDQIGPFVPEVVRQVFWSEAEIAQIQANAVAQKRYEKLAQDLINSLYA
jgi:hypothetical protein